MKIKFLFLPEYIQQNEQKMKKSPLFFQLQPGHPWWQCSWDIGHYLHRSSSSSFSLMPELYLAECHPFGRPEGHAAWLGLLNLFQCRFWPRQWLSLEVTSKVCTMSSIAFWTNYKITPGLLLVHK